MKFADRKISDVEWLEISIKSIDSYINDIIVPKKREENNNVFGM